jgi:3-oxoacyl-[acyl-carrier-protein] synthase-3
MTSSETLPALAVSGVARCLPDRIVDVHAWAARCDFGSQRIASLMANGVQCFHDAAGESPVVLATQAVSSLLGATHTAPQAIDALVYAHTFQTSVIAPPAGSAHRIQSDTGLDRALAFSVSQQNCVSPLAAVHVLQALMAGNSPIERAIVVCADVIASGCDHLRAIHELALHSDGACALLLERGGSRNRIAGLHLYTDASAFRAMDDDMQPVPDDRYYWSAFATMRAALGQAGISGREVGHVLPHHVSLPGWRRLMTMLGIAQERLFTRNFERTGHVFGADPFINFNDCEDRAPGDWSLLFSSGLARCFGAMVIHH